MRGQIAIRGTTIQIANNRRRNPFFLCAASFSTYQFQRVPRDITLPSVALRNRKTRVSSREFLALFLRSFDRPNPRRSRPSLHSLSYSSHASWFFDILLLSTLMLCQPTTATYYFPPLSMRSPSFVAFLTIFLHGPNGIGT